MKIARSFELATKRTIRLPVHPEVTGLFDPNKARSFEAIAFSGEFRFSSI